MSKQLSKRLEQLEKDKPSEEELKKFWAKLSGVPVEEVVLSDFHYWSHEQRVVYLEEQKRSQV